MTALRCDVAVVGAGPAGALAARALSLLGRDVVLCEATDFPRDHVGICLNAGAARMLAEAGLSHLLRDRAHFQSTVVRRVWENSAVDETPRQDLICDRGILDRDLLAAAGEAGATVLQPARVIERTRTASGWMLRATGPRGEFHIDARFLLEASGRRLASRRHRLGPPTLALFGRWTGNMDAVCLAALERSWVWAAPTGDGQTVVLTVLDPNDVDLGNAGIAEVHARLACRSSLLDRIGQLASSVGAIDSTPFEYLTSGPTSLRIGEAALGLDPLSSSGLSSVIQSALSGAIVANTLLDSSGDHDAALEYVQTSHTRRRKVHVARTAATYALVSRRIDTAFWAERASGLLPEPPLPVVSPLPGTTALLKPAARLQIRSTPCVTRDRIERFPAIHFADGAEPIAFVNGIAVAMLIQSISAEVTAERLVCDWSAVIGAGPAIKVLSWAWRNRILVSCEN